MKKFLTSLVAVLILVGCQSKNDPAAIWMFSILEGGQISSQEPSGSPSSGSVNQSSSPTNSSKTETYPVNITISDVQGNPEFLFNVTETVPIRVTVQDAFTPVKDTLVQVKELDATPEVVLFQAVTDAQGNITGSFSFDKNTPHVELVVVINGQEYAYSLDLTKVIEVNRVIRVEGKLGPRVVQDRDQDGVPDKDDMYPDDPTRASKIRVPGDSFSTVAFEDLYPRQGDADFNDYVVRVVNEEDLNAQGNVVRIRGTYEHTARGAGYTHTLNLRLPSGLIGRYETKLYGFDGNVESTGSGELSGDLNLLPKSSTTLTSWNSKIGELPQKGKKVELEIILENAVSRLIMGGAPYDLYLYVNDTKREIHFLGKYLNEDGTDKYLDPNGFPWAILIPGIWKHPYERVDVRSSYEKFRPWYESKGTVENNWYQFPTQDLVFPVVE